MNTESETAVQEQPAVELAQRDLVPATSPVMENAESIFDPDGELVVDVYETPKDFVVLAAIAGVQIKDLDISVEKEMMVIKGQRPSPHGEEPGRSFYYQECYWGPFSRKIILPENVDTEAAQAQMDKGMLTITVPKTEAKPAAEEVKIS